jgi:hypothetical protein
MMGNLALKRIIGVPNGVTVSLFSNEVMPSLNSVAQLQNDFVKQGKFTLYRILKAIYMTGI